MTNPTLEQIEAGKAAVLANFHPPTAMRSTWHLNPETVACAVLVAVAGVTPQEPGEAHDCTGVAVIGEVESLKKLLEAQRQRADFWERRYEEAAQVDEAKLAVSVPAVPFGPVGVPADKANAGYYRSAAKNIRYHARRGRSLMGSNLTEAVAQLCDATADALFERQRLRGGGR